MMHQELDMEMAIKSAAAASSDSETDDDDALLPSETSHSMAELRRNMSNLQSPGTDEDKRSAGEDRLQQIHHKYRYSQDRRRTRC